MARWRGLDPEPRAMRGVTTIVRGAPHARQSSPSPKDRYDSPHVRARGGRLPVDRPATATLENTYWKLMRLGSDAVTVADDGREPHFILQAEQKRVAGSGGCNRMMGSYALDGSKLTFSQIAGTMMACPQGMEVERAFYAALPRVATWRIDGETLELFDAGGAAVAEFESRYLN